MGVCSRRQKQNLLLVETEQSRVGFLTVKQSRLTFAVSPPFVIFNLRLLRLRRLAFPKKIKKKKKEKKKKETCMHTKTCMTHIHTQITQFCRWCWISMRNTAHTQRPSIIWESMRRDGESGKEKAACDDGRTKRGVDLNEGRLAEAIKRHANSPVWDSCNYDNIVTRIIWLIRGWT